jgi:NAD(P)-dependent dehydrogenase (short-subunit alcohol dehydrogenase family)
MAHSEFTRETTSEEVAEEFCSQINGRVFLITGATFGGIGAEAGRILAKYGAKLVILAGRSLENLEITAAKIKEATPDAELRPLVLDLSSLASVRKAAAEVNSYEENIDVLINNAGVMGNPYTETVDKLESQFGTNHVGHFLLTNLILSRLLASPSPRVVNLTSVGHEICPILFDDIGFSAGKKYDRWHAYGQSKTANILFTRELAKRHERLVALAVHPGAVGTNLMRHNAMEDVVANPIKTYWGEPFAKEWFFKSLSQGAATTLVAALDPAKNGYSGSYMDDCQVHDERCMEWAKDMNHANKLWKLSEDLVGQKFD